MFLTSTTCHLFKKRRRESVATAVAVSRGTPVAIYFVDINRRKIGRYTWYLRNFDRPLGLPGHRRQCFWLRQHVISSKMMARVRGNCCCNQLRNNSCDLVDVNRRKIRRYTQYLWKFDRLLLLPSHHWWCFWRRQRVISSKNDGASSLQLLLPSVMMHVATISTSQFCGISTILHVHFSVYFA